jgi:thioredoxin 1
MKAFLIIAALLAVSALSAQSSASTMMKSSGSSPDASTMKSDSSTMMKAEASVVSGYDLAGMAPKVIAYTTEKDAWARAASNTVVYFFAASWCPTCQETYRNIKAGFASLPDNLVIVFVDYDKAKDLKKKYDVTYQHSFVSIGSKGEARKTWSGTTTVADIIKNADAMM